MHDYDNGLSHPGGRPVKGRKGFQPTGTTERPYRVSFSLEAKHWKILQSLTTARNSNQAQVIRDMLDAISSE